MLGAALALSSTGDVRLGRQPDAGARIVVIDPLRQWADPLRVATEFHQCGADQWLESGHRNQRLPSDPQWIDSWREREIEGPARPSPTILGTDLSEPLVARVGAPLCRPKQAQLWWRRRPCRSGISSGLPRLIRRRRGF